MVADLPSAFYRLPCLAESFLDGRIEPLKMSLGCACLVVAVLTAHASAALLVYSPTKLQRLLGAERGPAAIELLRNHDLEFRVLARLLMIGSAAGSLLLTNESVSGTLGQVIFLLICLLTLILIGVLPAAVAQRGAEPVVSATLPWLRRLRIILLYPIIRPLIFCCRPILRALKFQDQPPADSDAIANDITAAVADSAGRDELADEERRWIANIVELKDLHVSEVMTPRTDIDALETSLDLFDAIQRTVEKGHSRFPVYEDNIDHVIGVFYAKDVLTRLAKEQDTATTTVGEMTRDPLFAPESMRVADLLREFRKTKVQIAIVLDEYGGTAGLITIEDILEEIVGEIADEFDPDEEEPIKVIHADRIIEVSGRTRVEDANSALAEELVPEGEDYDTVAGFVFAHLGQIPTVGDTFQTDGVEFRIISVDNRRIDRLRLTRLAPQPSDR